MGNNSRHFEVTKLNWKPIYTKILYLSQKGVPVVDIHKETGLSTKSVERIRASQYFKERFSSAQEAYERRRSQRLADIQSCDATQRKLDKAAKKAADILLKALKGSADVSRQQIFVAKDILDRTGYKAKEKIEVETFSHNYTPQEIQSAQVTLLEVRGILDTIGTQGTSFILSKSRTGTGSSTPALTHNAKKKRASVQDAEEVSS